MRLNYPYNLSIFVRMVSLVLGLIPKADPRHYSDVIMNAMVSQVTSVSIVSSTVCSGTDQIEHQSSASLAFVRGIHRWPVDSPHKGSATRKMFLFDDITMVKPQPNTTNTNRVHDMGMCSTRNLAAYIKNHAVCEAVWYATIINEFSPRTYRWLSARLQ